MGKPYCPCTYMIQDKIKVIHAGYFTLQCQGQQISWKHVVGLYHRNAGAGTGVSMVAKIKYEHIFIFKNEG